jgi:glycosyltransferase involved in cell wall biosynthesis
MYESSVCGARPLFLPVSNGVRRELEETYAIGTAPVRVVPNAADLEVFKPLDARKRQEWRDANGFRREDFICVFSGGEWARKGLDDAIKALSLVKDHRVFLFVAGDDPDRKRFHQLVDSLALQERIVFGGFRNDIATVLGASDLFLFPSHYEAFSLATIEAAACGLPLVATRINGTEDFIQSGETGVFVRHDPKEIADAVASFSDCPEMVARMGANACELVRSRYTWDRVAAETEDAYMNHLAKIK